MRKLLYFLSNTDQEVIVLCPADSYKQLAKGAAVLAIGLLSTFGFFSALYIAFDSYTMAAIVAILCGMLLTLAYQIMGSVTNKGVFIWCLALSASVGLLLSLPFEISLFRDSIKSEQTYRVFQKNEKLKRIEEIQDELASLKIRLTELDADYTRAKMRFYTERSGTSGTGRAGNGAVARQYRVMMEMSRMIFREEERIYGPKVEKLSAEKDRLRQESVAIDIDGGLLWQLTVLDELRVRSASLSSATLKIRLLLVLLFTLPIWLGLLEPDSNYKALLKQKRSYASPEEAIIYKANGYTARFRSPTFSSGFASAMDWAGDLTPAIEDLWRGERTPEEADAKAMARDWEAVSKDFNKVLNRYAAKLTGKPA